MSKYRVYKHPDGRIEAVKDGFSITGTIFGGFWLLWHKMWLFGTIAIVIGFGVYAAFPSPEGYIFGVPYGHRFGLSDVLNFFGMLIIGLMGNGWRMDSLKGRGFDYVFDTQADNPDGAKAAYLRENRTTDVQTVGLFGNRNEPT
ncbi:MAG: DUF2628 domain-containing protein [Betaproteobacteria bacterium]|nr:DUF2628 domain-containing protein [Betaproteobacteria bacterium]